MLISQRKSTSRVQTSQPQPATGEPSTEEFLDELSLRRFVKVSRLLADHATSSPHRVNTHRAGLGHRKSLAR